MIIIGISIALIGTVGFYTSFGETPKVTTGRMIELPKVEIPEQLEYSRILLIILGLFVGLGTSKIVMMKIFKD